MFLILIDFQNSRVISEDEVLYQDPYLYRTKKKVDALYAAKLVDENMVKEFLINKIKHDDKFAKRCIAPCLVLECYKTVGHGERDPFVCRSL